MAQTTPNTQSKSTQNSLLISEIKDGIVVMQDGSLRAVALASAINFDLMSAQEQNSVEYSYQGFLNSLHFPVQINIKSQKIDLDGYLEKLSTIRTEQSNPLLGELMDDYIANIRGLVEEVNIMDKRFYVVVPYFPPVTVVKAGLMSNLGNVLKPNATLMTVNAIEFDRYKTELSQRLQQVVSGLGQMGIRAIPLNTQELIELYYACYNPDVAVNQKLMDSTQFQGAAVTRGGNPVTAPVAARTEPVTLPAPQPQYSYPAPAPLPEATPQAQAQPQYTYTPPAPLPVNNPYEPTAQTVPTPVNPPAPAAQVSTQLTPPPPAPYAVAPAAPMSIPATTPTNQSVSVQPNVPAASPPATLPVAPTPQDDQTAHGGQV